MSKHCEDWADWAGDHPEQAEAELRYRRERQAQRTGGMALLSTAVRALNGGNCEHESIDTQGVCENCDIEVEGWEPDDAQLLTQTGTKEPAA